MPYDDMIRSKFGVWQRLLAAYSASALLVQKGQSCIKEDLAHRTAVQNKLAGVCVDMCKDQRTIASIQMGPFNLQDWQTQIGCISSLVMLGSQV